MSDFEKNLIFMILQFLHEGNYKETAHKLEQESGVFFDMKYFENEVKQGNWDEVERYLFGFTTLDANRHSLKIFFEIRKQKYLEAIDKHDGANALDILIKDMKVFKRDHEELFKEMTQLLTLKNFRQHEQLSMHGDTIPARENLFVALKSLIGTNPLFKEKLQFPSLEKSRLHTLINQSLSLQHSHSVNLRFNPFLETRGIPLFSAHQNDNIRNLEDVKPILSEAANVKHMTWKLTEISEPAHCLSLRLPDELGSGKISRLIYTNSGTSILAIASNAIHLLWKWPQNEHNLTVKATTNICPQLWQPRSSDLMVNDKVDTNPEEVMPCFALSKNDFYVLSSSGGKISLFNMNTFMRMTKFMPPPPAATCLIFYPEDNNIFVIGMANSTIKIYHVREDKIIKILDGHHSKRITGLAFSKVLNVLVSSDAYAQICVWKWDTWEKQNSTYLQIPAWGWPVSDTRVQFHKDEIHFLVVHQTQLAVYETTKLVRVNQWIPRGSSVPITDGTLSCDGQLVYASFLDATVRVFSSANLQPQCRINPSAYLPANVSSTVHPLAIAAHPSKPNQFALGLTDGGVLVIEPLESDGKWGEGPPPTENASAE